MELLALAIAGLADTQYFSAGWAARSNALVSAPQSQPVNPAVTVSNLFDTLLIGRPKCLKTQSDWLEIVL